MIDSSVTIPLRSNSAPRTYLNVVFRTVPCRHDVCIVDILDERLDLESLADFFLAHTLGDLAGVSFNASHEAMWELASLLGAFIHLLYDHRLPSSVSSSEKHHESAWL